VLPPDESIAWFSGERRDDALAFERLFRSFAGELTDFARSYVGTEEDAADAVHVVFCWLWEHRFTIQTPRSVRSYLFAAVRNRALNLVRDQRNAKVFRERAQRAVVDLNASASLNGPDAELVAKDLEQALMTALREMSPRCREVYVLVRDHEFTYAEVAEALDIAPKTVEIHMARALAFLRKRLAPWLSV
jgi:RNA polymerase sigma-70 factor (family 1)